MEVSCGRRGVTSLLLLYLFVASAAAADCPQPPARANIVLSNEALLLNAFPEGSEVTLECGNGYVPESGSGIINCVDNNWTEPDLQCKKMDCGLPKPQPHMSFNTSAGTLFGALIRVLCDKGFQVSGASYRQCYAFGWSGRAKCETITCDKPAEVTNGRNSWESEDDPSYGEIVRYVCDDGYALVGKENITCSDNGEYGEYDSRPPSCQVVMTEDRITTKTTPPTPPAPEATTSTESPTTPTARRDNTVTTGATPAVSPSGRGGGYFLTAGGRASTTGVTSAMPPSFQGGRYVLTAGSRASTTGVTSAMPPSFQGGGYVLTAGGRASTTGVTSAPPPSFQGGGYVLTAGSRASTTGVTSALPPSFQGGEMIETNKDTGYVAVVVSVICVTLAVVIAMVFLYKYLLKRKGSSAHGAEPIY